MFGNTVGMMQYDEKINDNKGEVHSNKQDESDSAPKQELISLWVSLQISLRTGLLWVAFMLRAGRFVTPWCCCCWD